MTRIRARAGTDAGGWIEIPVLGDDAERDRWAGAVVDAVARAHGDRFDAEAGPGIRRVMAEAADDREESDLLVMAFLPTARPIVATVRVFMMTPSPVDWWRSHGFALSPIHAPGAGHGMLATRTLEETVDEERLVAHQTVFIFTDGELDIAVFIEPTAALVFDRMQEGLIEIVASLTLEFEDGRTFVGARRTELPDSDVDSWDGTDSWNIGLHVVA
ncbi:hypothetical protein [Microbacterium sp.]|uniref:hypothetical protein n=1 Tax=Microbacterium sp. TaxID=51671 RepID=UPI003A8D44D9